VQEQPKIAFVEPTSESTKLRAMLTDSFKNKEIKSMDIGTTSLSKFKSYDDEMQETQVKNHAHTSKQKTRNCKLQGRNVTQTSHFE